MCDNNGSEEEGEFQQAKKEEDGSIWYAAVFQPLKEAPLNGKWTKVCFQSAICHGSNLSMLLEMRSAGRCF